MDANGKPRVSWISALVISTGAMLGTSAAMIVGLLIVNVAAIICMRLLDVMLEFERSDYLAVRDAASSRVVMIGTQFIAVAILLKGGFRLWTRHTLPFVGAGIAATAGNLSWHGVAEAWSFQLGNWSPGILLGIVLCGSIARRLARPRSTVEPASLVQSGP